MATTVNDLGTAGSKKPVYVFEVPVRVWHWVHAISIFVLIATGLLIAHPPSSPAGEASENFLMGNIRMIHFMASYVFTIGLLVRIYWGLVGNKYAKELLILPIWSGKWWKGLIEEIKYYTFIRRDAPVHEGHNPLAQAAMWVFNILLGLFMIVTGFALYSEGLGLGSWADTMFGWALPLMGGSQNVKMLHTFGMWLFIMFTVIHIYMAIRADWMGKQSSLMTIINGWRTYKDKA